MKKKFWAILLAGMATLGCLVGCEEEKASSLPVSETEWAKACEVDWENFKYVQDVLTEMDVQGETTKSDICTEIIATDTARYRKWTHSEEDAVGLITEEYYVKRSDGVYSCRYSNKVSEGNYEWGKADVDWEKIFVENIVAAKALVETLVSYYENLTYDEEKDLYFFKDEESVAHGSANYGMTADYEIQLKDGKLYTIKANTSTNAGSVIEQEIFMTFGKQTLRLPEFN
ncbi:MAG: hypothetical protein IJ506_03885 [Clostridia bacterium]|nr:hypothetical protein [Clostridia bacterium]